MLHDLVVLKHSLLETINTTPSVDELKKLRTNIDNIKNQVPVVPAEHVDYIDQLIAYYDQLIIQAEQPSTDLKHRLQLINDQIFSITQNLFAGNYELEEKYGSVDFVRTNRKIKVSEEVEQIIKQKIALYTNWRYPSLEIGCRDGEWTQYMVAADPLYLMDRHTEFLASAVSQFTPEYQRRLRQYALVNHNLSTLPAGQMAFVFSWSYFNYVSLDTMKQYLRQVFDLLRPGGIFMFSYNDGDTTRGAGMAENFAETYMPKSMLVPLCESLGYQVVEESDKRFLNTHWIELRRPGTLETNKAHQVMGEIKIVTL
jgi:SAM-dependent methyltransferase